ncbi:hypothetical protein [Wenjunlia tyrosinilytica]|uniref:hypothetical protein n=1 Tax=Wenjunlia tyrosinilytica TaxID=1544741 RepID=UPI001663C4F9
MRRGVIHTGAWLAATTAAVALSWFGVHSVLAGTAYDPPRAVATTGGRSPDSASSKPLPPASPSASRKAGSSPSPSAPVTPSRRGSLGDVANSPTNTPKQSSSPDADWGDVKSYTVSGGRVAFDLGGSTGKLVSATPDSGWRMKVWNEPAWIRVDFTEGGTTSSVFCTWNGHPPTVDTWHS